MPGDLSWQVVRGGMWWSGVRLGAHGGRCAPRGGGESWPGRCMPTRAASSLGSAGPAPGTPRHPRPAPGREDRLSSSCAPSFPHHVFPPPLYIHRPQYIHRPRRELGGSRAPSFPAPRCMHYRPPDDPPTGSRGASWNRPWKVTHEIVRTGRARGVRRSRSPPPGALVNVRIPRRSPCTGKQPPAGSE